MGIQFTPDMMSSILGYVGDIFNDVKLPVLLICGIALGFFILNRILQSMREIEHPFTSPTSPLYGTHLDEEDEYED